MSIPFPGFIGPSYSLFNIYAGVERSVNWYSESVEDPGETKARAILQPSPGNAQFGPLPVPAPFNQPNRGLVTYKGNSVNAQGNLVDQVFGVNGNVCFAFDTQLLQYFNLGTVANDGRPVSFAPNANAQIFFCSGGIGYVIQVGYTPSAAVLIPVVISQGSSPAIDFFGASYATFQDGYILVVTPNSNQFQISGDDNVPVGNAGIWNAANISIQAGQADNLVAIISSREYVRLLGRRRSQVYQNIGAAGIGGFPFQSYNETFIETGCAAAFSLCDLGGPLFWIGQDARGQRAAWLDPAFQPQRVSNYAVEQQWQAYSTVEDAVAFPFIWMGHLMVQITFPTADKTWVYDVTESQSRRVHCWHERTYTDFTGSQHARAERFHVFANELHLVASSGVDGNPGAIYQYSNQIVPVDMPAMTLRWSNDAGETYGPEYQLQTGAVGQYGRRVYMTRLGYGRDRVYWLRSAENGDCGTNPDGSQNIQPIVRDRICPHIYKENKRIIYSRLELELQRALAAGGSATVLGSSLIAAELDIIPCAS